MKKIFLIIVIILAFTTSGHAWIFPEHRDITFLAIQKLDSAHRIILEQLWASARKGYESRLNESLIDSLQGEHPTHLDYATWPAIGGDHSTSSVNMLYNILQTEWIMDVADIAARLKTVIENSRNKSDRINRLRDSDIRLLRVDAEYLSRASANNGHFMLAIPYVNIYAPAYFDTCFKKGCAINPVGTYKWFHASALMKAGRLSTGVLTSEQRSSLALSALADEAFALHFLEDAFASGHVAGVWGDAAQRKGTHDYYNESGLEVTTWKGERVVLMGDAYLRPEDAERAARSVCMSLEQLLDAASGKNEIHFINDEPELFTPDTLDVGKAVYMPYRDLDTSFNQLFYPVLITTPVPGLATGLGELPRFRSELGPFIGIAPSAKVSILNSGFGTTQNITGIVSGLELGIRIGLGMEGVLNQSGDGLVFLDLGWRLDGPSTMKFDSEPILKKYGSFFSALPSRDAYYARLRIPFCLIPGDLLVVGPFLYLFSQKTFKKMATAAGNGGLIPWQSGIVTPIGRIQFILGREIGVCVYGTGRGPDSFLVPDQDTPEEQVLVSMYSTQIDFPIVEYRPLRKFSSRQTASLVLQINAGLDIPGKVTVIDPVGAVTPEVKTTWFIGFRLAFDWRYYFSKTKG